MWNRVRVRSSRTAAQYWAAGFQAGRGRIVERGRTTGGHMARRSSHEIPCALIFHHFSAYLSRLTSLLFCCCWMPDVISVGTAICFSTLFFCLVFSFSFADVVCEKKLTFGVTLIFLAFYKAVFFFLLLVNVGERRKLLDSHVFLLFPVAPARRHEQLTEKKLRLQSWWDLTYSSSCTVVVVLLDTFFFIC